MSDPIERSSAKLSLAIEAMQYTNLSENALNGVRILLQEVHEDIMSAGAGGKNSEWRDL